MNFPLYTSLLNNLPKKELTIKQKKEFIDKTTTIDNSGAELIYALIISYYNDNKEIQNKDETNKDKDIESKNFLPYEATSNHNIIEFDFEKFPSPLKQLLYKFINIHLKSTEEDKNRE
jgi:hypothetical protein|uniref:NET domain-containing protein n=1 Tax=viral metagenome TaxID=1070528 RepID=A0A6C0D036_9ZZZZ